MHNPNETIVVVAIILICISIVGMLFTLTWFCIYNLTLQYTFKNAKALETIDYTPVLRWLLNIYFISVKAKNNQALAVSFDILFKNYYEMYGERFILLSKQTTLFLDNNSSRSWPLLSNYFKARELNKRIEMLRLDARDSVANMQDILQLQLICRNWFVEINAKSNLILEMIHTKNQKTSPNTAQVWRVKSLNETQIYKINLALIQAKTAMQEAKYQEAINNLKEVSSILGELTNFIDSTDKIINLIDHQLRKRLQDILEEIKTINLSINEKEKNINAFMSLENSYYAFLKAAKMDIYSLNIDDAYKKCKIMIDQIHKHESNLKYEMLIKNFIKSNFHQMQNVLNQCNKDILKTLEIIDFNNKFGKKTVAQRQKVDEIQLSFNNLKARALITFREQSDSKIMEYTINHKKRGQEIKDIYEKARVILLQLDALRNTMKSEDHYKVQLESKIISFKKMLLATELIIAKNPKIPELNKYKPQIQKHFDRLREYENILKTDPDLMKSQKNIDEFSDYLDESNSEIAKLKTEIAQNVYIAKLAEMSLSYASRFGGIESLDYEIQKALEEFENSRYRECLNKNITFLKAIKSNNRSAVA